MKVFAQRDNISAHTYALFLKPLASTFFLPISMQVWKESRFYWYFPIQVSDYQTSCKIHKEKSFGNCQIFLKVAIPDFCNNIIVILCFEMISRHVITNSHGWLWIDTKEVFTNVITGHLRVSLLLLNRSYVVS